MKYTAEEVRKSADWLYQWERKAGARNARAMLIAYAERIEADEMAADYPECSGDPSSCQENEGHGCCKPNPPAQAAQVDRDAYEGAREDLLDWKGRAQRAEAALRSLGYAGVDASQAPAWPAVVLDGAVEVLRKSLASDGHAVSIVFDSQEAADRFHTRMDEAMKVRQNTAKPVVHDEAVAKSEACKVCGKDTPHHHLRGTAPTPASPIDLAAVRKVITHLRSFRSNTPPTWAHLDDAADKLEAALQEKGNG